MMSPASKWLPGTTSQRATVPSVIVSPSFGMTKSVVVMSSASGKHRRSFFEECRAALVRITAVEHKTDHALLVRKRGRQRHVGAMDQRPLELFEHQRALGRNLRCEAARLG